MMTDEDTKKKERRERYKNYALAFMTGIVVGVLIS